MTLEIFNNMDKIYTLFEWSKMNRIQPLDVDNNIDGYMLDKITHKSFKSYLKEGKYKVDILPIKPEKFLEYIMYGLVPYNISPIQQGIQYDHAKDNYSIEYNNDEMYQRFVREWKTSKILNGGDSNEGHLIRHGFKKQVYIGTMQSHLNDLKYNNIKVSTFYEPSLNSMLSAIVFLVDERVFNKQDFPDFESLPYEGKSDTDLVDWFKVENERKAKWVSSIGGPNNEFLREFLKDKKLA